MTALHATPPPRDAEPLADDQFDRLRQALAAFGGIFIDDAQRRVLEAAVASRLAACGEPLVRYEQRVTAPGGREELRRLAELVLNHETCFFRNQPHLRALRDVLLPEIHRRKPAGAPIRIWSAGCATGEEPYSIAIAATEALGRTGRPVEVYGTDLSELALEKARAGIYRGRSLANVTPARLARFFQPCGDGYRVADALRAAVRFARLNLLDPLPPLVWGCDVIFCQNVTIYFQADARRDLIARFFDALPPHGLLLLGFSETLWNVFDGFHSREVGGAYVYYKGAQGGEDHGPRSRALQPKTTDHRPAADDRRPGMARVQPECREGDIRPAPVPTGPSAPAGAAAADEGAEALAARPSSLVTQARAHADRGELELAEAELLRALARDALNEEAHTLLGVIYGWRGEWQAAAPQLERARYLRPSDPLVSFHLADAYRHTARAAMAAREYRSTLRKLEPHPPDAILGGVAVGWLRETCERQLQHLPHTAPHR